MQSIYGRKHKNPHANATAITSRIAEVKRQLISINNLEAIFMPRPHISGYFWKRIFFYPFSPSIHMYPAFLVTEFITSWKRLRRNLLNIINIKISIMAIILCLL